MLQLKLHVIVDSNMKDWQFNDAAVLKFHSPGYRIIINITY